MMEFIFILLALISPGFTFPFEATTECNIKFTNGTNVPLLIINGTNQFLYPKYHQENITLDHGASVEFVCPGSAITGLDKNSTTFATATCDNGKLKYKNKIIKPETFQCTKEPDHIARFTNRSCENNGKEAEIGYPVGARFIRVIQICFDAGNQNTLYSHYNLTRSISSRGHEIPRPYFIEDPGMYNMKSKVNNLYFRNNQRNTINTILGLPSNSTQYVQDGKEFFLARGHMTAKADFIYAAQQRATFHYVNVAPQWQCFNEGNWLAVENGARYIADSRNLDLQVYTGSYGVATLPHSTTGGARKLYLYINGKDKGLPVPKLYWKVLYDPKGKTGVALVGVNNPYLKKVGANKVCKDISSQINWLAWKPNNATAGFSYACSVDDLRKTVTHIPQLNVKSLLV